MPMAVLETISGAITGIKADIGLAQGVMAVDAKVKDSTHNKQLAELNNKLAEILNSLSDSMVEVSRLKIEKMYLEKKLNAKLTTDYTIEKGVYKKQGLPLFFCPHCLHKDGTESVLSNLDSNVQYSLKAIYICNTCKGHYGEYEPP
jgi:hypothetical protein